MDFIQRTMKLKNISFFVLKALFYSCLVYKIHSSYPTLFTEKATEYEPSYSYVYPYHKTPLQLLGAEGKKEPEVSALETSHLPGVAVREKESVQPFSSPGEYAVKKEDAHKLMVHQGRQQWPIHLQEEILLFQKNTRDQLCVVGANGSLYKIELSAKVVKSLYHLFMDLKLQSVMHGIFLGSHDGMKGMRFLKVNLENCDIQWIRPVEKYQSVTSNSTDKGFFVLFRDGKLRSVNLENGQTTWTSYIIDPLLEKKISIENSKELVIENLKAAKIRIGAENGQYL